MESTSSATNVMHGPRQRALWLVPALCLALSTLTTRGQDPFTKITTGPVVTDSGDSCAGAWGDYDDDGFVDLFVSRGYFAGNSLNALYHNERNGTFLKVTSGPMANDRGRFSPGTWGDYDNDGDLDFFAGQNAATLPVTPRTNALYRNLGGGQFEKIIAGDTVTNMLPAGASAWVDYNRDGLLDLFVVTATKELDGTVLDWPNSLFLNEGNGSFRLVTEPPIGTDSFNCEWAAWADYDNDGRPDLVATRQFLRFYHQEANGSFVMAKEVQPSGWPFSGLAWGDYDNDGLLDLYQGQFFQSTISLFHNLSGGQWEELTLPAGPNSQNGAWGDYDNDGYLDLFVTQFDPDANSYNNRLYHNNRDGTFTQFAGGESVVTDPVRSPPANSCGCSWADYDNDGFLDLFVAKGYGNTTQQNFLYHNNGNPNHWLLLRLKGTVSNRAAIGTRVKVLATIWGKGVSQTRDVGGSASWNQGDLRPHFGLGDATRVTTLWVEWPSGLVQEFADLPANQILTIEEGRPALMKPEPQPGGTFQFQLNGGLASKTYVTEALAILPDGTWTPVSTNAGPTALVVIPVAPGSAGSFYRVKER